MYRLGPRTLPEGLKLDGGSDWVCLSKDFIDYILDEEHRDTMMEGLLTVFNYTLLPAESFFHTALRNSHFCSSYVNNNLRITNWKRALGCKCQHKSEVDWCGCSPMVFRMDDWEKIRKSKPRQVFFARKFDAKISQTVINEIDQWIIDGSDDNSLGDRILDESYTKYWETIFHHIDDSQEDNPILDLSTILLENISDISDVGKIAQVEEVTTLFIHDELESLLVLFRNAEGIDFETRFVINSELLNVPSLSSEVNLSIGSQFDVKEHVFRHLVQILGIQQVPQLLIRPSEKLSDRKGKLKIFLIPFISSMLRTIDDTN